METSDIDQLISVIERASSQKSPLLVALDGRSGTGKSTISALLASRLTATVIVQDDFYTGGSFDDWASRSAREKVDHVIDWQRLRRDVLEPLLSHEAAEWRTFNWQTFEGLSDELVHAQPAPVIVLDGAYSTRPELADLVDLSVLVRLDDNIRRKRIRHREGADLAAAWHQVWDEAEEHYFTLIRPPAAFDIILNRAID